MVSLLTKTDQLHLADALLQLGPCEVVFDLKNPRRQYADQRYQNLCLALPADQLAIFREHDAKNPNMHPFVRGGPGDPWIQVKVDTRATHLPLAQLVRGQFCQVIISPKPWVMEGKEGISLSVQNLRIVEPKRILCDFI